MELKANQSRSRVYTEVLAPKGVIVEVIGVEKEPTSAN